MKKRFALTAFTILSIAFLNTPAHSEPGYAKGVAIIKGTTPDSPITGKATFEETDDGVKISVEVENVPNPGNHGFHIHQFGNCEDTGKAAGGHYNPSGAPHGLLTKDGHEHAHAGDMGNIIIDANGKGKLETTLPEVDLTSGVFNIAGRAVILHEKADDFGQPTGNAGGRIGCGIITVTEE
jgi:Cu-Zn family superoxide dismutase